ncbi:MFS transporter [Ellagibacter isourolithinifaciens]|uniref:MFS transporter n=1 Tax=Ellagibacter isourolithinifaciens TaxID=2137581 RepID=UPI003AF0248E
MTTKEAVPKSTQSKRNPLTSACPTTSATTPLLLVIYRFFIGVFVGADYPIATSLITEFTPKHHRAISMGMVSAAWYLGATVAAVVGFALCDVDGGWRLMLGSAIIPCVFLLIGRCKVPESPLWLKSKGRHEEARRVVFRVYGADVILVDEEEEPKHKTGFAEMFSKGYAARIVFWESSRCARSFPCTPSTRSARRS